MPRRILRTPTRIPSLSPLIDRQKISERSAAYAEAHQTSYLPRGGKGLIERISNEATVPVIKHLDGCCGVSINGSGA